MPTRCSGKGKKKVCQWGSQKRYKGAGAKAKAQRQGRAIALAKSRRGH